MARMNIFEKLNMNFDLKKETERLHYLFSVKQCITALTNSRIETITLKSFISQFCFNKWINRGHFLDLDDFLTTLGYKKLLDTAPANEESLMDYIELCYNMYELAYIKIELNPSFYRFNSDFELFGTILNDILERNNFTPYYHAEAEQILVVEKDAAVTAVVEIEEDSNQAFEIVQYNHRTLKGDIGKKKSILFKLGAQLEPKRKELDRINSRLSENIFTFLNNMNIRHNNIEPGNSKYKQWVADMKPEELESWYDELYQMILLARLELDNVERMKKADELRKNF